MRFALALVAPLLAVSPALGAPPPAPAPALSAETSADLEALAKEDSFALGGIGVAGTMSRGEKLARAIAARPDAIAAFEVLANGDHPAGRVYAYWALRELEPDKARVGQLATRLQRDRSRVSTIVGCIRHGATVATLVDEIASGRRIRLLRKKR